MCENRYNVTSRHQQEKSHKQQTIVYKTAEFTIILWGQLALLDINTCGHRYIGIIHWVY